MSRMLASAWMRHPGGFNAGILWFGIAAVVGIIGLAQLVVGAVASMLDGETWRSFVVSGAALMLPAAFVLRSVRPPTTQVIIRSRDVFLVVTLAWTVASLAGAVPVYVAGHARSFVAATFEAMSGFTTTGSTIFSDVDGLPDAVKLWRSVMHWLGGIGIVVLLVGIAPALGIGSIRAIFAEMSGPTDDRYTPRIVTTARALVRIYLVLSVACVVSFMVVGLNLWEAVNHAMATVSTGGFSTRTASFGAFGVGPKLVAIAFMALSGVNFGIFILLSMRRRPSRVQGYEMVAYVVVLAVLSLIVAASVILDEGSAQSGQWLLEAAFAVVSVVTTTGFVSGDFDQWNEAARALLFGCMFIGGSAGSTVGGVKIIRWLMLGVAMRAELRRLLHPTAVVSVRVGGRRFEPREVQTLMAFIAAYVLIFVLASFALIVVSDIDLLSALSGTAASINLVGPGLGELGASESYAVLNDAGLGILTFVMLLGRLELFTVLVLLLPAFWRRR